MNRLTLLLLIGLFFSPAIMYSQTGYVFIKKGIKKKKTYQLGDPIALELKDGSLYIGYLTQLSLDTMFVNGRPVHKLDVKSVLQKRPSKRPFPDGKTVALIAAGSLLTSVGLAMSDPEHKTEALIAGPVIGFGPLLITHFTNRMVRLMHRGKYKIGKKFYLQVLDLDIPRAF